MIFSGYTFDLEVLDSGKYVPVSKIIATVRILFVCQHVFDYEECIPSVPGWSGGGGVPWLAVEDREPGDQEAGGPLPTLQHLPASLR